MGACLIHSGLRITDEVFPFFFCVKMDVNCGFFLKVLCGFMQEKRKNKIQRLFQGCSRGGKLKLPFFPEEILS